MTTTTTDNDLTQVQQDAIAAFNQLPAWTGARMLSIDCLEFTSWNVNSMTDTEFNELVAEIDESAYLLNGVMVPGFDEPIGVMPIPGEPGRYLVPSGEHRVRAVIALKFTEIPAVLKVHLTEMDQKEIKLWSVRRNHLRGRVNAQKWAALEKDLSTRHGIRAEILRERALIKGERLKRIRKNQAVLDNEDGGGTPSRGGKGKGKTSAPKTTPAPAPDPDPEPTGETPQTPPTGAGGSPSPENDSDKQTQADDKARAKLMRSFKAAWEEALVNSADTVEHGYLVLADGKSDKCHVVVDTPPQLANLAKRMVAACRGQSATVAEFLTTAISNELKSWEER